MRMLQTYKSRKYLLRMLLSITFLMAVVLCLSSVALHYSSETQVLRMQKDANRKVMNQINYNIDYMQEIVGNLAMSLYNDDLIYFPLMSNQAQEKIDIINSIQHLSKAQTASAFLHSIMIYNGHLRTIYAVGQLADAMPDHIMAEPLAAKLKEERKLPQMQLIPMNLSGREHAVDFFSLVIYETFYEENRQESALVLNIKPEWIFDNLRVVNDFAAPDRSGVLIMDDAGSIILPGSGTNMPNTNGLAEAVMKNERMQRDSFGFFSRTFPGGEQYVVTYMDMGVAGWKVVSYQPYDAVLGGIYHMRITSALVILAFLLLAVFVSVVMAHKLYKPVEVMLTRVRKHAELQQDEGRQPDRDELAYVTHAYSDMANKLYSVMNEQDQQKSILRTYHVRSIITGSAAMNAEQLRECVEQNKLQIAARGPFLIVVVKIDDYLTYLSRTNHDDRLLYAFAIANIAADIMAPGQFRCETADMRSDHLAMIVSGGAAGSGMSEVPQLLEKIQDTVASYYKLSLSMTTGDVVFSPEQLAEQYAIALRNSAYKLVFGKKSILTPERVKPNIEHQEYDYPAELEKKLIEAIRMSDLEAMESTVGLWLEPLSTFHYDHIIHGILHLVDIIKTTIREINHNRLATISINLSDLSRQALEQETLDDIAELIRRACRDIHEKLRHAEQDKNAALIDAIKEIVETNYADMNLSLQGIASMMRMTPAYVGRMFKQSEFTAVGEYINEVRLAHAKEFLETKNFSIKEIMEMVGFMNESTFFKLFKRNYGVTPKEYRLKRHIG